MMSVDVVDNDELVKSDSVVFRVPLGFRVTSESTHPQHELATRPCAVSVEECSVGRRTGNTGLEIKNI